MGSGDQAPDGRSAADIPVQDRLPRRGRRAGRNPIMKEPADRRSFLQRMSLAATLPSALKGAALGKPGADFFSEQGTKEANQNTIPAADRRDIVVYRDRFALLRPPEPGRRQGPGTTGGRSSSGMIFPTATSVIQSRSNTLLGAFSRSITVRTGRESPASRVHTGEWRRDPHPSVLCPLVEAGADPSGSGPVRAAGARIGASNELRCRRFVLC